MKIIFISLAVMMGLFFSANSFADCYSCASQQTSCSSCTSSYRSCDSCGTVSAASSDDCEFMNKCACSEPSCGRNPCLSRRDCCAAFGNVGSLKED